MPIPKFTPAFDGLSDALAVIDSSRTRLCAKLNFIDGRNDRHSVHLN